MASDAGGGSRSLEVQRARAEERRQRLEEFRYQLEARKYELEQRKHELEKTKVINDTLKHFITVITALLFILAYFGDEINPLLKSLDTLPLPWNLWDVAVVGLTFFLTFSLITLIYSGLYTGDTRMSNNTKFGLGVILIALGVVISLAVLALS